MNKGTKRHTQVDQNGIVYDLKTGCEGWKNEAFTAVFRVYTVRFRSVLYRIIGHRNTYRIVTVNRPSLQHKLSEIHRELLIYRLTLFRWCSRILQSILVIVHHLVSYYII